MAEEKDIRKLKTTSKVQLRFRTLRKGGCTLMICSFWYSGKKAGKAVA
jgi:hypothetical protein